MVLKQIATENIHGKEFRDLWQVDGKTPKTVDLTNKTKANGSSSLREGLSIDALYTIER
jgi:hypothetical protein